ncbi:hypothetical protein NX059_006492 [Plenodomus lindquistii]|nr:hypothetical protein NX059_006492 [Plenodomus lindquistii]
MSGFAIRGAANGPYGPANPPPPPPGGPPPSRRAPAAQNKIVEEHAENSAQKSKNARKKKQRRERFKAEKAEIGFESPADGTMASVEQQDQPNHTRRGGQYDVDNGPNKQPHDRDVVAEMHNRGRQTIRSQAFRDNNLSQAQNVDGFGLHDNQHWSRPSFVQKRDYRSRSPLQQRDQHSRWQNDRANNKPGTHAQNFDGHDNYRPRYRSRSRSPVRWEDKPFRRSFWMHDQRADDRNEDWNPPQQSYEVQRLQAITSGAHRGDGFAAEDEVDWDDDGLDADTGNHRDTEPTVPPTSTTQHAFPTSRDRQDGDSKVFREQEERRDAWMNGKSGEHDISTRHHGDRFNRNARPQSQRSHHDFGDHSSAPPVQYPTPAPRQNIGPLPMTVQNLTAFEAKLHRTVPALGPNRQDGTSHGKVKAFVYGGNPTRDLGLCHATFLTPTECPLGHRCFWRHHPLNEAEVEWITANCSGGGNIFLANVEKFWAYPSIPLPGANLVGKGV